MLLSVPFGNHCYSICCCASSVSRAQVFYLTGISSFSDINRASLQAAFGVWPLSRTLTTAFDPFTSIQELWLSLYHMLSSSYPLNTPDWCLFLDEEQTTTVGWSVIENQELPFFYYSERVSFKKKKKKESGTECFPLHSVPLLIPH